MMTLIALAITVAFVFSVAVTLGWAGMPLWEELATLVTVMLLGHWIEMRSIKMIQNLWWAAGYNIVAIPLAAGVLAAWGILLAPAVAAIFTSASTVIVALNAQLLVVCGATEFAQRGRCAHEVDRACSRRAFFCSPVSSMRTTSFCSLFCGMGLLLGCSFRLDCSEADLRHAAVHPDILLLLREYLDGAGDDDASGPDTFGKLLVCIRPTSFRLRTSTSNSVGGQHLPYMLGRIVPVQLLHDPRFALAEVEVHAGRACAGISRQPVRPGKRAPASLFAA
jgi:hypothetical protein